MSGIDHTTNILVEVATVRNKQRMQYPESHDDEHTTNELVDCAFAMIQHLVTDCQDLDDAWPFWHFVNDVPVSPEGKPECEDDRDRLINALALLVAEVERIDRAKGA